ncbi:MAG TPA: hypothetical protein VEG84_05780 [Thermoanaerobaculia bacterium]|nr:hypothetical protein [Thermoanaerobaculia bacterium]
MTVRCWGIYRELAHSPGRETDDAEILRAVARELGRHGLTAELKSPDELPETNDARGVAPFLFVMCERVPLVARLAAWERQGIRIVNRPQGIRNTDRERTITLFERHGVPYPSSVLVPSRSLTPSARVGFPCWVKRGDVHATESGDVTCVAEPEALSATLQQFASRDIDRVVLQEHVPGDLIKFYGVGAAGPQPEGAAAVWFEWFYHRDQKLSRYPFEAEALRATVFGAAAALGLEVFGGDAIVTPAGSIVVIDLNAWPSFALYRHVAAEKIAAHLTRQFRLPIPDPHLSAEPQWPR